MKTVKTTTPPQAEKKYNVYVGTPATAGYPVTIKKSFDALKEAEKYKKMWDNSYNQCVDSIIIYSIPYGITILKK